MLMCVRILYNYAKGGLSNIWGTLSSPFFRKDIENWGISYNEFYREKNKVESILYSSLL